MDKIHILENKFYSMYPDGFQDTAFDVIHKKHNIDKLHHFVEEAFPLEAFDDSKQILEDAAKLINRSTLVSRFEKPLFKKFMAESKQVNAFVKGLKSLYHEDEKKGFESLMEIFRMHKLDKWPIISAFIAYKDPMYQVFIKPTTTKKILKYFEIESFKYDSKPSYAFYTSYRDFINELKACTNEGLHVNNPAFCGFLLMTIEA